MLYSIRLNLIYMIVFITGANRGIGLAQTKYFLNDGDIVFTTYRNPEDSTELFKLKDKFPKLLHILQGDITIDNDVTKFYTDVLEKQKCIDVLINNAGVDFEGDNPSLTEVSLDLIRDTFEINTIGMIRVIKSLLPLLKASERRAVVCNTSSGIGSMTNEITMTRYGYMMSKASVNMLSRIMAHEFKKDGITTVAWSPGWVKTRLGTENATLTLEEAGKQNVKIIKSLNASHNGKFVDVSGDIWKY